MNVLTLIFNAGKFIKLANDVKALVEDITHGRPIKDNIDDILNDVIMFLNAGVFAISDDEKQKYLAAIEDIRKYALDMPKISSVA